MKKLLSLITVFCCLMAFGPSARAQSSQTVQNGQNTSPINFPPSGCIYKWVNNTPGIGLPAGGIGNIPYFTAINNGNTAVTATITATAVPNDFAYIVGAEGNQVAVVSLATNQVIVNIPVGSGAAGDAVTADGSQVYVTDSIDNQVSVITAAANSVTATVNVGKTPTNIAVSVDAKWVYVVNFADSSLSVINAAADTVIATIRLPANPYDVAVSPDGSRVYVSYAMHAQVLTVIDAAARTIITNIPLHENAGALAVAPDGSKVYLNNFSHGVSVIDATANTELAAIPLKLYPDNGIYTPYGIAVSPDGSRVYAYTSINGPSSINVINTATQAVTDTITTPGYFAYGVALTPDGSKLVLATAYGWALVIDPVTHAKTAIELPSTLTKSLSNYVGGPVSCSNTPLTFTITVTPTASPPPLITPGAVTGNISGCQGDASVSPYIEQFSVSAAHLTGGVTATAMPGFELSLSPNTGYASTISIPQTAGNVNTNVYVRSQASDAVGTIAGNVTLTSPGAATQVIPVNGTVNALPVLSPVASQVVNNGQQTAAVNFPNSAIAINWVNDMPGIGLPASGSGNISPFTAVNNSDIEVTATITATPKAAGLAYISSAIFNRLLVINVATNTVIDTLNTQGGTGVEVSSDGSRLYIANNAVTGSVSVINTTTKQLIYAIPEGLDGATSQALSPDGGTLYLAAVFPIRIDVVNTNNFARVTSIVMPAGVLALLVSPDGSRLYAALQNNQAAVIDTKTNTILATIPAGNGPVALAISPDGKRLYLADAYTGNLMVFNTATNQVAATITVSNFPLSIEVSPDGTRIYVLNNGYGFNGTGVIQSTVSVIDAATYKTIASIPVGIYPDAAAITHDGSELYVVNAGFGGFPGDPVKSGTISVISTATNSVIKTMPADSLPGGPGHFISAGVGCSGAPVVFTIKVKPSPKIIAGTVSGTITTCAGTASVSPNLQQFTVSGINLTGDISLSAPAGFELSLSKSNGYSTNLTLAPEAGTVPNTIIYARMTANAPAGTSGGQVSLTSPGAVNQSATVSGSQTPDIAPSLTIATANTAICTGTPTTFTATATNAGAAPAFQWQVNGVNAGTNSDTFTSSMLANGDVVSCMLASNAPCAVPAGVNSNAITMQVGPEVTPALTIEAAVTSACAGTPITFTATPTNGGGEPAYQWLVNGAPAGTNSDTFVTAGLNNGDVVTCVLTSNAACTVNTTASSNGIPVTIYPLLTVNAGAGQTIDETASVQLNPTTTGDIASVSWSPTNGLSNANIINPVASPLTTTTYVITVQSTAGCTASDTIVIEVILPPVVIPNTFTPNGDGINDTWDIKYLDLYPACSVQIFTRWGAQVYSSIGYPTPWNGAYHGSALPDGTYYYVINLQLNGKPLSGFVTIIK